jgi:hypothetical protein
MAILSFAALIAVACGRAPSPAEASPNIPMSCASVFKLPSDVLTAPDPLPPIVNLSTVAEEDASAWARGVVRSLRVEAWAMVNSQDALLMSGCLGDSRAQAQLFGDEAYLIGMARRTNSSIVVTPAEVAKLTLIEVSDAQQTLIAGDQQIPSRYAWLLTTKGPAGVLLVAPSGDTKVVIEMRDGESARDFYGGFYQSDSWAGPLWFQQSYFSCVSTKGHSLCT